MIPIYKAVLREDSDGLTKMSLVDYPAVESEFLRFDKDKEELKFSIDEVEHIVFGVALRANYPIYRNSSQLGEYYIVFTPETIKEMYEKFMIEGKQNKVSLQHTYDVKGVSLIQSFIKDKDKGINPIGFEYIEDGSWFVAYKIQDNEIWQAVTEGKFNGFSVECFVDLEKNTEDELDILINDILNN